MSDVGNTIGRLFGQSPMAEVPAQGANPHAIAETPEEDGWFSKWWGTTEHELNEAMAHPGEAVKGAAKGIANIPADLGEMLMKGSTLQSAGEMEQAAAMQSVFGQTKSAEALTQAAQEVRTSANSIELPKFQMSNPAQAGGDKIATAASLLVGGAGLVKGGIRGVSALGKATAVMDEGAGAATAGRVLQGEAVTADGTKVANATTNAAKSSGTVEGTATGTATKDGAKVLERVKSLREQYLGRTPGKGSRTGREVQARMRQEGKLRDGPDGPEFKASDGEWYPLKDADMAHKTDAVKWWNETGRAYGSKSEEVRDWMLDSKNYTLDHYSINRSLGAQIGETYLLPLK